MDLDDMRAKTVNENINFERGRDPKRSMKIGSREYILSLNWPTARTFLKMDYLDDPNLEVLEYKGFTILLKPEGDMGGLSVHNPWDSKDIWTGMFNSRYDVGIGGNTRAPGRDKVLRNLKRSINYRLRNANESINFERGQDPREAMGIGHEETQIIRKLDRLAKKYEFHEAPFGPQHEEEGVINIKRWVNDEEYVDDEIEVLLFKDEENDQLGIYFNGFNGDGIDPVDAWLHADTWENYFME
jgi:hypothetical protein